ncbi:unnamed protein product [Closterium sp. NIES-64]|nr:unnamed protein product [Closterium sp. NIES-64]
MFFMLGLLLDDTFNHVIKHALEMPRPPHTCAALEVCDSHGMPSAHSQFMSFFATFATWLVFYKMDYEDERWRWITAVLPWPFTFLTMASRVYLGYHTIPQVLAGFTLGILLASTWFYVVHRVLAPFFASPYHSSSLHSPFTPAFQVLAGFTLGILSASFWFYVVHRVFAPFFPTISDSVWGRHIHIHIFLSPPPSRLQVLAGFTLGILSASFWFYVVHRVFAPFFPAISDSVWGRYLCIKDDCHIRNVAVFEYLNSQRAREEQRAREKAQNAEQEKLLEKSQEKTQEKVQQGKEEEVDEQQGGKQQQSAEESAPDRSAKTE